MINVLTLCTVSLERVREAIKVGNKIITLVPNNSRCIGLIKLIGEENGETYVAIDLSQEKYAYLYFKTPSNQRLNVKDMAYWIEEENDFYNYYGELEAPF